MAFIKTPVTGMRDILPLEKKVREKIKNQLRETYIKYGFSEIETPIMEHIENLTSKEGGENEKLIFRVLMRGDKLKRAIGKIFGKSDGSFIKPEESVKPDFLSEEGLRYDLTVPLSRYYAANFSSLPHPFKAIQIGAVFRADRPQKGRFREFTQCDIDILGDETSLAEKELILATTDALDKIGFSKYNYYIVINDRRLLFEVVKYCAFDENDTEKLLITLDKIDKIGPEGVYNELLKAGFDEKAVGKLIGLFLQYKKDADGVRAFASMIGSEKSLKAGENIADIMEFLGSIKNKNIRIKFDPSLVRGMGYYTGTIFEIKTDSFASSIGGGGRYDAMVGKFLGKNTAAVGLSLGFERVMTLIMEGYTLDTLAKENRSAWLIEKGMPMKRLSEIFNEATNLRIQGKEILLVWMAKNKKFQKENLKASGYEDIRDFYIMNKHN